MSSERDCVFVPEWAGLLVYGANLSPLSELSGFPFRSLSPCLTVIPARAARDWQTYFEKKILTTHPCRFIKEKQHTTAKTGTQKMLSPIATEAETIDYSLTLASRVISFADPDELLTEAQGAVLAISAAKKASKSWNPNRGTDYNVYFRITLEREILKALENGNFETYGDAALRLLDAANNR